MTTSAFDIDPEAARSWTLPADLYHDPAVSAREQQRIFGRTWQIAGRMEQIQTCGDFFCTKVAGEPVLIVRDDNHELRGFYNICRHRAGPPAEGCGNRKVFRC